MPMACVPATPASMTSLEERPLPSVDWTTATLRWGEENSSANIFINDATLGFAQRFDLDPAEVAKRTVFRVACSVQGWHHSTLDPRPSTLDHFGPWTLDCTEPPF